MAVPDTNTFSLADVRAEIEAHQAGTFLDLQACVNVLIPEGSPLVPPENILTWAETYPNSLYGFRGYSHVEPLVFYISPTSLSNIPASGGTYNITLTSTSTSTWVITEPVELLWVDESSLSGAGSAALAITIAANLEAVERTGQILITPNVGSPIYINISQLANQV
jgi:hypothetical protein